MKKSLIVLFLTLGMVLSLSLALPVARSTETLGPTVVSRSTQTPPTLDGKTDDWHDVPATVVTVIPAVSDDPKNHTGTIDVELRAVTSNGTIYFSIQWPDPTKSATHKTLHWDKETDGYIEGKDREDRLAIKFDMGGDFQSNMLSGTEYKADIWHWKAYRSQTAGIAHDKMHIYALNQIPLAKKHLAKTGQEVWIARPSDKGDKLYKSQRPVDHIGDAVPRYLVNPEPTGSIADVKTAAAWEDGLWTLEISRKLQTGHDDDIGFEPGKSYRAAVAVFDHTGDDHHSTAPFVLEIGR
jgi:DMSO reductase family type II enzyme heme b subunit